VLLCSSVFGSLAEHFAQDHTRALSPRVREKVTQATLASRWHRVELGATRLFQRVRLPSNQKDFILTITIAVACGLLAVSYHSLILFTSKNVIQRATELQGTSRVVWILIVPTAGGLAAGLLIYYFAPDARGSGIP